jgi:hypothetical protein
MSSTRESLCMCDLCRKRAAAYARIEAFAAIRRAAAVARRLDDRSALTFAYGNKVQAIADGMSSHNIRRAIRVAIGSEKL